MGEAPRPPGFPCPNCREAIVITLPELLYADSVTCSGCGTVVEIRARPAAPGKKLRSAGKAKPKPKPKRKRR